MKYNYKCRECGAEWSREESMSDPIDRSCDQCGSEDQAYRVIQSAEFQLTGGCWESDGYSGRSNH